MEHRGSRIIVRTIGVLGIIYNLIVIAVGIYATYNFYSLTRGGIFGANDPVVMSAVGYATFVTVTGILGPIACIAILWIKEWAFYLFYGVVIITWLLDLIRATISLGSWVELIVITIIAVIIFFQQRILFKLPAVVSSN